MFLVPDKTHRFAKRPHYEQSELDNECERIMCAFLLDRYGRVEYPIATDDLVRLLESVAVLDQFAALSSDGTKDLWGITEFLPGKRPMVSINTKLSFNPRYENPFRTTLTHEFAHVKFHGDLFALKASAGQLFDNPHSVSPRCKREHVEGMPEYDWAEWQAAYCSGALLMPVSAVRLTVTSLAKQLRLPVTPQFHGSVPGQHFIGALCGTFSVSASAAKVRLAKLGILKTHDDERNLLT